jgi:hypothetical protein
VVESLRSDEPFNRGQRKTQRGEMMCSRSFVAHRAKFGPRRVTWRHHGGSGNFFGLDVEEMGPRAQIAAALTVLAPVALGAIFVLSFAPQVFWLVFVFGWMVFPSFGLLIRGLTALPATPSGDRAELASASDKERELLQALRRYGELTPARAAMETSLSVADADQMLEDLAAGGHLEVRTRGVGLSYALWSSPTTSEVRRRMESTE